ncbi:MAG: ferredoxin [bacterium]
MKITIDQGACIECGTCHTICPAVFDINEEGKGYVLENSELEKNAEAIENAVNMCPVQAIKID